MEPFVAGAFTDSVPFEQDEAEPAEPPYRDPVVLLLVEHRRVAANLREEVCRHEREHGCAHSGPDGCDLRMTLIRYWDDVEAIAEALDFVALGEITSPGYGYGWQTRPWFADYVPGPWRSLDEARP
jgi:hypothetical protein